MNLCKTCGTICPFDDERTECDAYAPMTNENWFISLQTEEKARWIATQCGNAVMESTYDVSQLRKKRYWLDWLKEKHNEMS